MKPPWKRRPPPKAKIKPLPKGFIEKLREIHGVAEPRRTTRRKP